MRLIWGVNRWVMIEVGNEHVQHQIGSREQLSALLVEMGVSASRSRTLATAFWHDRPSDAALGIRRVNEAMWRSSGLRWWQAALVLVIALTAYVVLAALR